MNKREYMDNLLKLCTVKQKDIFSRMYPEGVTNVAWATTQLENTLRDLNESSELLRTVIKESEKALDISEKEGMLSLEKLRVAEEDLRQSKLEVERLSNPINVYDVHVQERLAKLDALEGGGVDNWDGYDYAMEEL